jgi:hypothetical protein
VQRFQRIQVHPPRPGWLTAGLVRLGLLSLFVVLVAMLRPRLTPYAAGWLVLGGGLLVVAGVVLFLIDARRLSLAVSLPGGRITDAVLLLLRRTGLPLLGLAFFLAWAFVYIGVWWAHPENAFTGLGPHPRFADFFYISVTTAFISPPGDILAHSRGARAATMIEMLTAFALLTAYLSSFVDWRDRHPSAPEDAG